MSKRSKPPITDGTEAPVLGVDPGSEDGHVGITLHVPAPPSDTEPAPAPTVHVGDGPRADPQIPGWWFWLWGDTITASSLPFGEESTTVRRDESHLHVDIPGGFFSENVSAKRSSGARSPKIALWYGVHLPLEHARRLLGRDGPHTFAIYVEPQHRRSIPVPLGVLSRVLLGIDRGLVEVPTEDLSGGTRGR